MRPAWRNRSVVAVALYLESCTLFLIFATVSSLVRLDDLRLPFWLVIVALVWAFGCGSRQCCAAWLE